uniref:Uncharacterized protein n=1 Tax=Rhizophora mucronata TaxID=61149 RepID=A0A2P2IJ90_RHIMU
MSLQLIRILSCFTVQIKLDHYEFCLHPEFF